MHPFFKLRLAFVLIIVLVTAGASSVSAYELSGADQAQQASVDAFGGSVATSLTTDIDLWLPQKGDVFEVNVQTNMGRLYHPDGNALEFEVVTGVRRVVRYIGLRYFAATPAANWVGEDLQIKRDRMTFGKTGRFIRLYKNGTDGTAYGIHTFGREDSMFRVPGRYGSMGCIIVRDRVMDLIQKTYELNDGAISVKTFPEMAQVVE